MSETGTKQPHRIVITPPVNLLTIRVLRSKKTTCRVPHELIGRSEIPRSKIAGLDRGPLDLASWMTELGVLSARNPKFQFCFLFLVRQKQWIWLEPCSNLSWEALFHSASHLCRWLRETISVVGCRCLVERILLSSTNESRPLAQSTGHR
jgi:hypothetical protein